MDHSHSTRDEHDLGLSHDLEVISSRIDIFCDQATNTFSLLRDNRI